MPITKSAIKRMHQDRARAERLHPFKTRMKTMMRKLSDVVKEGKADEAVKLLPLVYKSIDTAAKKQIIHPKNAARKKSNMARLVAKK